MFSTKHLAALAGTTALAMGAQAAPLQIDFSTGAGGQAGWETFGGTSATATQNKTFSGYTDLATGDVSVTLSGITFNRLYKNGFTGTADNFPGTDLDAMYSDLMFRNAAGTMTLTIGGLKAGTYQITTYHMTAPVTTASRFDLKVQDADSPAFGQNVGNFAMGQGNTTTFNPTVALFVVESNGTDNVIVQMNSTFIGTGGNTGGWYGYNGMEIALVPEPSSLALLGLGGLLIARRRRD